MTVKDAINTANTMLRDYSDSYLTDVRFFLSDIISKPTSFLIANFDYQLTDADFATLISYVKRRIEGEPVAYILEKKEFMGLDFYVKQGVLIPRPDTETVVETALDIMRFSQYKTCLDLCCGSGCIGLSIACILEDTFVVCADISDTALEVTRENVGKHFLDKRVKVEHCDVLSGNFPDGKFDIIISNPPYIRSDVIPTLDKTVKDFEPHLALDGGDSGMIFYEKILDHAKDMLNYGGVVVFEIGYDQREDITNLCKKHNASCAVYKDYGDNDRVAVITFE